MITLKEIQEKFPLAHHAPDPECKQCNGTGVDAQMTERARNLTHIAAGDRPCLCLFVQGELRDMVREALRDTVRKIRKELSA